LSVSSIWIGLIWAQPILAQKSVHQESVALFIASPFVREAVHAKLHQRGFTTICPEPSENVFMQHGPDFVICDGTGFDAPDRMLIYEHQVLAQALQTQSTIKKFILLSSSGIYPKEAPLPLQGNTLLTLNIKTIQDPYALAKLSTFSQCHKVNDPESPRYIMAVYSELYGPQDPRCKPKNSHPLYQAVDRIAQAKKENHSFTVIANDGSAKYDLLYIDDFAEALVYLLQSSCDQEVYNIATGRDQDMETIVENLHALSKYKGEVILDKNCYDKVSRRVLDTKHLYMLGWTPTTSLQEGLAKTFDAYAEHS